MTADPFHLYVVMTEDTGLISHWDGVNNISLIPSIRFMFNSTVNASSVLLSGMQGEVIGTTGIYFDLALLIGTRQFTVSTGFDSSVALLSVDLCNHVPGSNDGLEIFSTFP